MQVFWLRLGKRMGMSMDDRTLEALIDYFAQFVTEHKRSRMEEVLAQRTRHIAVVVEDILKPHNASAVVRSCDCFGVQDFHVVENRYEYDVNPSVSRGASKWVDVIRYRQPEVNNTETCFGWLKERGYTIYATTPHGDSMQLPEVGVGGKVALLFGNELEGASEYALQYADRRLAIPMYGFTESFNLSVSAAICLYDLTCKLRASGVDWRLSDREVKEIKLRWYKRLVKHAERLQEQFLKVPTPSSSRQFGRGESSVL